MTVWQRRHHHITQEISMQNIRYIAISLTISIISSSYFQLVLIVFTLLIDVITAALFRYLKLFRRLR